MKKPYYVLLTGSKNNAGDYLIKYRAKKLLDNLRPDRSYVDLDAWKKLNKDDLDLINSSLGVICLGGPALQAKMYPSIYALTDNLDDIKVPIMSLGIGWKSANGDWKDSRRYDLSPDTIKLLSKIDSSGHLSSVRDYHTLNVLQHHGFNSFKMTGCPAYYEIDNINDINAENIELSPIKKLAFSLGVSFLRSKSIKIQMQDFILKLRDKYNDCNFEVVFHHSLSNEFLNTHNATKEHLNGHKEFVKWLDEKGIKWVDISGSADNLINYYSSVDLHIGYRVHAHIFMTSIGRKSILLSEDGRGKGVHSAVAGLVFDGHNGFRDDLLSKILFKFGLDTRYIVDELLVNEVLNHIDYEVSLGWPRFKASQTLKNENFEVMKKFILQLP